MKIRNVYFAILLLAAAANSSLAQGFQGGVTPIERPDFWEYLDFMFQIAWSLFDIVM